MRPSCSFALLLAFAIVGAGAEEPQLSYVDSSMRVVSWRPRVFLYENFLNDTECDHLIAQAKQSNMWKEKDAFNSVYFTEQQTFRDPLLWNIELKMAVITASPPHGGEETMCIHRILPSKEEFNLDEIHHDKVSKEFSSVTILTYLSDVDEGGETIWPCTGKTDKGESVSSSCKTAFDGGARWFNGEKTVVKGVNGQQKKPTPMHADLNAIRDSTHAACGARADGFKDMTHVQPKRGSAAVFFHNDGNGQGDAMAWHTGCRVRKGTKWTMQKFKELPQDWRGHYYDQDKQAKELKELQAKQGGKQEL
jgi:prolyl 4-hydroxylase